MTDVRWGFLGAGFVATRALAPAVHAAEGACLARVAARDAQRAARLGPGAGTTDGYRALVEADDVDVVYVALSNDAHLPWTLAALDAGKHVVCEKPLGLDAAEVGLMLDAADRASRLVVEATWNRWHPRTRRAEALARSGALGEVRSVDAGFTFGGVPAGNYRLDPARGGGALYDVGCYAVGAALWATGFADAADVRASSEWAPTGVDLTTQAQLRLGPAVARVTASIGAPERQWLSVAGEDGSLELPGGDAFTSWQAPSSLLVSDGGSTRTERFAPVDPYRLMVEAVSRAVRGDDAAWMPARRETLLVARVMDLVREAAQ